MLGGMRRYLIVANRTLGGTDLLRRVQTAMAAGPACFHIVAPAGVDGAEAARQRVTAEIARLREAGADVDGVAVDAQPLEAIRAELERAPHDEIIVCTRAPGLSRWLHLDLVHRIERLTDLPVQHVITPAGVAERLTYRAVRLSIHVGESDRGGEGPVYSEIVRRARAGGLAGATVLRGVEGFGASNVIHTSRLLTMSEDLPIVVVIVDTPEHIEAFLPELDELLTEGLVVREDVDVIAYTGRAGA
jgi:uncharacterized protein